MSDEEKVRHEAERLHHLSMRYAVAFLELAQGRRVGLVPRGYPGLKEFRDLVDLILLARAEINCLTKLLYEEGVSLERINKQMAEEYAWLTAAKEKQLGCKVTDVGLEYKIGGDE